ncbi:Imm51 family immunity protein [Streptomyces sp. NPDC056549]|uniref:Imm51 family immunity protein n=1 Tax=Streptomyces sp. NPDC056549 TaxID=3345864 RepID=UPI00369D7A4F
MADQTLRRPSFVHSTSSETSSQSLPEQVADVFEEHNAECHGYGWEGLAQSLARSHMPENGDKLQFFGSEAGTFVVTSPDLKALTDLAVLLHSAFHNRELLSEHILTADPRLLPR